MDHDPGDQDCIVPGEDVALLVCCVSIRSLGDLMLAPQPLYVSFLSTNRQSTLWKRCRCMVQAFCTFVRTSPPAQEVPRIAAHGHRYGKCMYSTRGVTASPPVPSQGTAAGWQRSRFRQTLEHHIHGGACQAADMGVLAGPEQGGRAIRHAGDRNCAAFLDARPRSVCLR